MIFLRVYFENTFLSQSWMFYDGYGLFLELSKVFRRSSVVSSVTIGTQNSRKILSFHAEQFLQILFNCCSQLKTEEICLFLKFLTFFYVYQMKSLL